LFNVLALAAQAEGGIAINADEIKHAAKQAADKILGGASSLGASYGVTCEPVYVVDRLPADGILSVAVKRKCDLIVMGSCHQLRAPRAKLTPPSMKVLASTVGLVSGKFAGETVSRICRATKETMSSWCGDTPRTPVVALCHHCWVRRKA
jgi:hypothetical protein